MGFVATQLLTRASRRAASDGQVEDCLLLQMLTQASARFRVAHVEATPTKVGALKLHATKVLSIRQLNEEDIARLCGHAVAVGSAKQAAFRRQQRLFDEEELLLGKESRHATFASWTIDNFFKREEVDSRIGQRQSAPFGAIVDVAGGRGQLSLELAAQVRQRRLSKFSPRLILVDPHAGKGRFLHDVRYMIAATSSAECGSIGDANWKSVEDSIHGGIDLEEHQGDEACGAESDSKTSSPVSRAVLSGAVPLPPLSSSSSPKPLLLAMHPDEATEAVVDLALAHRLPFAVVPCCVLAPLFPERRLAPRVRWSGGEVVPVDTPPVKVRKYSQFLEYLMAKHPRMQTAQLGFEGRDSVLYMTEDDFAAGEDVAKHRHGIHVDSPNKL